MSLKFADKAKPARKAPSAAAIRTYARSVTPVVPENHGIERSAEDFARSGSFTPAPPLASAPSESQTRDLFGGQGDPLPALARASLTKTGMPPTQIDSIRVHADTDAARMNESLGARALTFGRHISFAPGDLEPQEAEGQRLLRHEAFHAAQNLPRISLTRADRSRASQLIKKKQLAQADLDALSPCDLAWVQGKLRTAKGDVDELRARADQKLAEHGHPEAKIDDAHPVEHHEGAAATGILEGFELATQMARTLLTAATGDTEDELDIERARATQTQAPPSATALPTVDTQSVRAARANIHVTRNTDLALDPITGIHARQLSDYGVAVASKVPELEALRVLLANQGSKIMAIASIVADLQQLGITYEPTAPYDLEGIGAAAKAEGKSSKAAQQSAAGAAARELHVRADAEETAAKALAKESARDASDYREAKLERCAIEAEQQANDALLAEAITGHAASQALQLRSYHGQVIDLELKIRAKQKAAETKVHGFLRHWGERRIALPNLEGERAAVESAQESSGKAAKNEYEQAWAKYAKGWKEFESARQIETAWFEWATNSLDLVEPTYKIITQGPQRRDPDSSELVDGPEHTFVRDRHHHEGTTYKWGELERSVQDRQRGVEIAEIDGARQIALSGEASEKTGTFDELLGAHMDLTGETEGKPDTIATYGAGGVTLGAGFTGGALIKMIFDFKVQSPDNYHRLFAQYGFEIVSESKVKLTIPPEDFGHTFLARNRAAPLPPGIEKGVTLDASDALKIVARDEKLLHVFADAAHDPDFRAHFAAWFAHKLEVSLGAQFHGKSWEDLGKSTPHWDSSIEFRTAWTLPFMHLATSGHETVKTALRHAQDCVDAVEKRGMSDTRVPWAPAWWGASYRLRHSTGKRDERLAEMGKGTTWWAALTDPKWETIGKTDKAREDAALAKQVEREAAKAAKVAKAAKD